MGVREKAIEVRRERTASIKLDEDHCFLRLKKSNWISDLKWYNHVICPAEGGPLI